MIGEDADMPREQIANVHREEFAKQRARVRRMEVRTVEVIDQVEQTIFEIYATLALLGSNPKYTTFGTY